MGGCDPAEIAGAVVEEEVSVDEARLQVKMYIQTKRWQNVRILRKEKINCF